MERTIKIELTETEHELLTDLVARKINELSGATMGSASREKLTPLGEIERKLERAREDS